MTGKLDETPQINQAQAAVDLHKEYLNDYVTSFRHECAASFFKKGVPPEAYNVWQFLAHVERATQEASKQVRDLILEGAIDPLDGMNAFVGIQKHTAAKLQAAYDFLDPVLVNFEQTMEKAKVKEGINSILVQYESGHNARDYTERICTFLQKAVARLGIEWRDEHQKERFAALLKEYIYQILSGYQDNDIGADLLLYVDRELNEMIKLEKIF